MFEASYSKSNWNALLVMDKANCLYSMDTEILPLTKSIITAERIYTNYSCSSYFNNIQTCDDIRICHSSFENEWVDRNIIFVIHKYDCFYVKYLIEIIANIEVQNEEEMTKEK